MNGWFLALIILGTLNVGINLAKHGKEREGNYSFFMAIFAVSLQIFLIYKAIESGL